MGERETTVQKVIDILMRVEDKSLPLIFRTKHINTEQAREIIQENTLDSWDPNSTVQIYDQPKQAVLELLVYQPTKGK